MRLHKDHKDWVKAVCTPEKAVEWFNEEDKWVYAYESLNDVGSTYSLTDNPEATDYLVDKVEVYYRDWFKKEVIGDEIVDTKLIAELTH